MHFIQTEELSTLHGRLLTSLSGGARNGLRRWSSPEIIDRHDVELVLGVRTQGPDAVEHRANSTDLAESLRRRNKSGGPEIMHVIQSRGHRTLLFCRANN